MLGKHLFYFVLLIVLLNNSFINNKQTSDEEKKTSLKHFYIYTEIQQNDVREEYLELLIDREFYIFELFSHSVEQFWVTGGWTRDRVNSIIILAYGKQSK